MKISCTFSYIPEFVGKFAILFLFFQNLCYNVEIFCTLWLHRCQNREHLTSSFRFLFLLEHVNVVCCIMYSIALVLIHVLCRCCNLQLQFVIITVYQTAKTAAIWQEEGCVYLSLVFNKELKLFTYTCSTFSK